MTAKAKKIQPVPKTKVGKSLLEFRAAHDKSFIIPNRIRAALKQLGDGWEYEAQFIRLAGISQTDMGVYRGAFEEEYVVLVPKGDGRGGERRIWCGTKRVAEKLREMVR